ncbi:MAG TPA: conjugal transfer protein TraF [Noviherbaspirillum sp.]
MIAASCHANEGVRIFDRTSFARIKMAHGAHPFVVMLWSMDCTYCEESFAALADVQRKHGIQVVTVVMDRITDQQTAESVQKKIRSFGLKSEVWSFGSEPIVPAPL